MYSNSSKQHGLKLEVWVGGGAGSSLKASEDALISHNSMKNWCTVTLTEYKKLGYCNLAAIVHIFFVSNNKQITAWSDEN